MALQAVSSDARNSISRGITGFLEGYVDMRTDVVAFHEVAEACFLQHRRVSPTSSTSHANL